MTKYYYRKEVGRVGRYGGRNITYRIYKLTRSGLKYMGSTKANTGGYRGDRAEVEAFISKKEGYRMRGGGGDRRIYPPGQGYYIARKDVKVEEIL